MNPLTKKGLIATSTLSVVYIFNQFSPINLIYTFSVVFVMIIIISSYLFSIKLDKESISRGIKFVLMLLLFNLSALAFIAYISNPLVRGVITVLALPVNFYLFIALKKVQNLGERAAIFYRNMLIVISFLIIFFSTALLFRFQIILSTTTYAFLSRLLVVAGVLFIVYFITYFLTWEQGSSDKKYRLYNITCALICAEIAWVSSIWVINYPVIGIMQKSNLGGTPLAAILITIVYYFLWGIISHKLENNLNRKILTEYLILASLFITVLLSTASWFTTI
ncbi:MAG: hypothetical protein WCP14_03370 [bacterium]